MSTKSMFGLSTLLALSIYQEIYQEIPEIPVGVLMKHTFSGRSTGKFQKIFNRTNHKLREKMPANV